MVHWPNEAMKYLPCFGNLGQFEVGAATPWRFLQFPEAFRVQFSEQDLDAHSGESNRREIGPDCIDWYSERLV